MEQNKKELLMEQANKVAEVLNVFRTQLGENLWIPTIRERRQKRISMLLETTKRFEI